MIGSYDNRVTFTAAEREPLGRSTRKYLRMKLPSRPRSGPPHLRQTISRSRESGPASARTSLYFAPQFGQSKRVVEVLAGMARVIAD
jgi:hypothetical protein